MDRKQDRLRQDQRLVVSLSPPTIGFVNTSNGSSPNSPATDGFYPFISTSQGGTSGQGSNTNGEAKIDCVSVSRRLSSLGTLSRRSTLPA